jgi:hypothetical protein
MENTAKIYPNPAQSKITIEGYQNQFYSFEIFDLSGRKMMAKTEINSNRFMIDVGQLLPGIYFLKLVSTNGESIVRKFSKT